MATDNIDRLYACFDVINGKNTSDLEKSQAFSEILSATKDGEKEKRLASQFIGRFFKKFPDKQEQSFNCLLDLCDDIESNIRKQAVHDLQQACKHEPQFISRVSDIFSQMLASDDASEIHIISQALYSLLSTDPRTTLTGIFNQMLSDNSESPRDHILKFLSENLKRLSVDKLNANLEEFIIEQTNKVLQDVSEEEFILLIAVLSSLKCMATVTGRQKLVNMITDQVIQAVQVFNPIDLACIAQVLESGKQMLRFLSKNVTAGPFLIYLIKQVLPKVAYIDNTLDQLHILRIISTLLMYSCDSFSSKSSDENNIYLSLLFEALLNFLPNVPVDPSAILESVQDSSNNQSIVKDQMNISSFKIFEIECLLYILVTLLKYNPNFLGFNEASESAANRTNVGSERVLTLRSKLQYLARILQSYRPIVLLNLIEKYKTDDASTEQTKIESKMAVSNIEILIRSLFRNRVTFDVFSISLSWIKTSLPKAGDKRPITVEVNSKDKKEHIVSNKGGRFGGLGTNNKNRGGNNLGQSYNRIYY